MKLITQTAIALLLLCACSLEAGAFTLIVVGPDGEPVNGFRWLLEEDATFQSKPGVADPNTLAVNFHASYMPLAARGSSVTSSAQIDIDDPGKTYFVSVLPNEGYSMSGARVEPGQDPVTVVVNAMPIPTAQISVFVFRDNQPINNAPDLPEETGLQDFTIQLSDAAGRYGIPGGQQMMDAFGNPLGTTYNPDGSVADMGDGVIMTNAEGMALIQNLSPGKYGVQVIPPAGENWVQTSTIEGSKTIDAWVKANEPPYFAEFGPPGFHVFVGFVQPLIDSGALNGSGSISGRVVNLHLSRPPDFSMHAGNVPAHTTAWIGLNDLAVGEGNCIYAQPVDSDGEFVISNVPTGNHQLVVWDSNLDFIIALADLMVDGDVDLGDVPVFQWFSRLENHVFYDANENGFRDPEEVGMPEVAVNLRFRDGTIYQSFPTDAQGYVPFDEVFPFFHWLVMEVDFLRFKATGATFTVDAGGPIDENDPWSFGGVLNPQPQPENNDLPYRTETGPVLTQAFQGFLGQTSVIQWGKKNYEPGENGGISGIVFYAVTRAENDPAYAAAEEWEPGIPRVRVNLYQDADHDEVIDDLDGDGTWTLADVDNAPFGNFPGPEDVDRDYPGHIAGQFDYGDAIQITTTDSWDDSVPSGCPGDPSDPFFNGGAGYDGMRNWNQIRPGVFDGGYAFGSYFPGGMASGNPEVEGLPPGVYIVEAVPPRGPFGQTYEIIKEEDKNVDFGEEYDPNGTVLALPPPCVGDLHLVPPELTLFPGVPAPFAGEMRPLADRKQVTLNDMENAAADFSMFTPVPIAAHVSGIVLDDLSNEFDFYSPQYGEKYAPPWVPISFKDWTGREIVRVYSDHWGRYNALVPSTFTANLAIPSGMGPNMLIVCINDPGPIPNPDNSEQLITDPFFDARYSQFCYTFQYMPGTTTYLDTPVVPVAAFAGPNQFPVDCELPGGTPKIYSAAGSGGVPLVEAIGKDITIAAEGMVEVLNPLYDGPDGVYPKTIIRDYGFGSAGGTVTINGVALEDVNWSANEITGKVAAGTTTGPLVVTRADTGLSNPIGVTVHVAPSGGVHIVGPSAGASATPIQDAIDAAAPGDTIFVKPGVYDELVIMWKPVFLQGSGAGSTYINGSNTPFEKLQAWRVKMADLFETGLVDFLPGQEPDLGEAVPNAFGTEEGATITVVAKNTTAHGGGFGLIDGRPNALIDGLTISGGQGGGIFVNGYARYLEISNNRITRNQGVFSGGIRIGHPALTVEGANGLEYVAGRNRGIRIHHNYISQNGGLGGAGGGVSLYTGSHLYEVTDNIICGNFTTGHGGGIGHLGLSRNGFIARNRIFFNQTFDQGTSPSGGGIYIGGAAGLGGAGTLSPGSGSVRVIANLIQGNQAGAGDGGGIRLSLINGQDVADQPDGGSEFALLSQADPVDPQHGIGPIEKLRPNRWHRIDILNNLIVNNVAGLAGAGMSLQDAAWTFILHNTITNNDSTGTAGEAFSPGSPNQSNPQPAGIVSRAHSNELASAFGPGGALDPYREYSNPLLVNNIVRLNRSFYFFVDETQSPPEYFLLPDVESGDPEVYWDLEVLGFDPPKFLNPQSCVLTDNSAYPGNEVFDPEFQSEYVNGDKGQTLIMPEITSNIQVAPALDEGGNYIDVRFGPLTLYDPDTGDLWGDYHLRSSSQAIDAGDGSFLFDFPDLLYDFDGDDRPAGAGVDIGGDEYSFGGSQ